MKVKIVGIKLQLSRNVNTGEFFQQIENITGKEVKSFSKAHTIFVCTVDNYFCGLILTYKNNKKSLSTQRDKDGNLLVNKSALGDGEIGTEVSLFCINPTSNKGLVYSYVGAASPVAIRDLFKKQHDFVKKAKRNSRKRELRETRGIPPKRAKQILDEEFVGDFELVVLTTPRDLDGILNQCKRIDHVKISAIDALAQAGIFTPLDPIAKRARIELDIGDAGSISKVRSTLKNVLHPINAWRRDRALRIIGESHSGQEINAVVGENMEDFGFVDYDEFVETLPSEKWIDYPQSEALAKLLQMCKSKQQVFGAFPDSEWKLVGAADLNSMSAIA